MKFEWSNDDEDVMARIKTKDGQQVTIVSAPYETLNEDGPTATQITEDDVIVVYADEFIRKTMLYCMDQPGGETPEGALGVGLSFLISLAMSTAAEKFGWEDWDSSQF